MLAIAHEPTKTGSPGEGPLHHPVLEQQHEASLGLRQLDHLQLNPMLPGGIRGLFARVALIDMSQIDTLTGGNRHGLGQLSHFGSIISRGGGDVSGQQITPACPPPCAA